MKKKLYIIALACLATLSMQARQPEQGEKLYFNTRPADASWWANDNVPRAAYFFNSSIGRFSETFAQVEEGNIMSVTIPLGDWDGVILTRHTAFSPTPQWGNVINQTGNINYISAEYNLVNNFKDGDTYADWKIYTPTPTTIPQSMYLTDEDVICSDANKDGQVYVLSPINYDYTNTYSHAWFKYNGTDWERIDGTTAVRATEGDKDYAMTPEAANTTTYYYLWAAKPSMRRLLRISTTADCSVGSPKITYFDAVVSEPNVTDGTCAIDGLVAFDDATTAGELWITCSDMAEVIKIAAPQSPQQFKMTGLDSNNKTYTIRAEFQGVSGVYATKTITTAPPASGTIIEHDTIVKFTEEDVILKPTNAATSHLTWTNNYDELWTNTTDWNLLVHTPDITGYEQTITYAIEERNSPEETPTNMMGGNSGFENIYGWSSDFTYWPYADNYYDSHPGVSGGFSIVQNAHSFAKTYNVVLPHEGNYFGLFDSDASGLEKAAWMTTTAQNPNLKVTAGITYLFSFWVANINNFGEMDNAAKLQFQISYDDGANYYDLGAPVDLADFHDNRWHCGSAQLVAAETSNTVRLRLINLNQGTQSRGNDFALDDIRFQAVTSRTQNIAGYEKFFVTVKKCVIEGITLWQDQAEGCPDTEADLHFTVNFRNPRGNFFIYEGTNKLAEITTELIKEDDTSFTGTTIAAQPLDGNLHNLNILFRDANNFKTDGGYHTYRAYTEPYLNITNITIIDPACDKTTFTVAVDIEYRNQNGDFLADIDGVGTLRLGDALVQNDATLRATTIYIDDLVADGKGGHLLNMQFNGTHGCSITDYALPTFPYMPEISEVTTTILGLECGKATYPIKVEATFSNTQAHDIVFDDGEGHSIQLPTKDDDTHAEYTFDIAWDKPVPANHTFKAYFIDAEACKDEPSHTRTYLSLAEPEINISAVEDHVDCGPSTYTLTITIDYINQDGILHAEIDDYYEQHTDDYIHNGQVWNQKQLVFTGLRGDGKNHKYRVWFESLQGCEKTDTYLAPFLPEIKKTTATVKPYACGDEQYTVRIGVDLWNSEGLNLIITDGTAANTRTVATTAISTIKEEDFVFDMATANQTHTFYAYFEGYDFCKDDPTYGQNFQATYKEPCKPSMNVTYTTATTDCSTTSLTYEVKVDYTYQSGQLVAYWEGGEYITTTIDENDADLKTATFNMQPIAPDGKKHRLFVRFTGDHGCSAYYDIDAPFIPQIASVTATPSIPAFGDDKYDLTVTANYTNAQSRFIEITCDDLALKHAEAAPAGGVITYTFVGLTTDNGVDHQVKVIFTDADETCPVTTTFTSPVKKELKNVAATVTEQNCRTEFIATVTGDFAALSGNIVIHDKTTNTDIYDQPATVGTQFTVTTLSQVSDGIAHVLEVYFTSDPDHKELVTINAPKMPQLNISTSVFEKVTCDGQTALDVNINFQNQTGDLVLTDENDNVLATFTAPVEGMTYSYHWQMAADGASHTAKTYFTTEPTCGTQTTFTAPTTPSMTFTPTIISEDKCDGTFTLQLDFNLTDDKDIMYIDGTDADNSVIVPTPGTSYTNTPRQGRLFTNKTYTVKAWYVDRPECVYTADYTPSGSGKIDMTNSVISEVDCNGFVDITVTLDYLISGEMIITDMNNQELHRQTMPTPADSHLTPNTYTFTLTGISAEQYTTGNVFTFNAYFEDRPECKNTYEIALPRYSHVDNMQETHSTPYCTETQFELNLTLTATNAAKDLVIKEGTTELARIPVTSFQEGQQDYHTTLYGNADGDVHILNYFFDGREDCYNTFVFMAPVPNTCIEYFDTICINTAYSAHGITLPEQTVVGEYQYQEKDSTVYLKVIPYSVVELTKVERTCDTETQVIIPYTIVAGEPNRYDARFDTLNPTPISDLTAGVLSGGQLVLELPDSIKAGQYHVDFTFYHTQAQCETETSFVFEVSEAGLIYSKWTDVLLINNADQRFTAFQWYEDGMMLRGETMQRLYRSEGLTGTYYCSLTTADGEVITTCDVQFSDVPRSAEINASATQIAPKRMARSSWFTIQRENDEEAQIRIFDATGRLVSQQTSTEATETIEAPSTSGLFIVSIETKTSVFTDKIIVE